MAIPIAADILHTRNKYPLNSGVINYKGFSISSNQINQNPIKV